MPLFNAFVAVNVYIREREIWPQQTVWCVDHSRVTRECDGQTGELAESVYA